MSKKKLSPLERLDEYKPANKNVSRISDDHPAHDLWRGMFLRAFRNLGTVSLAADAIGVTAHEVRKLERSNVEFAEAMSNVRLDVVEDLTGELIKRAKGGSDILLMFLLKKLDNSYRDNHQSKIEVNVKNVKTYVGFNPDMWDKLDDKDHVALTETLLLTAPTTIDGEFVEKVEDTQLT